MLRSLKQSNSGEISPKEYAPRAESAPILDFYMGKNTPERKDYIMDSLVVPVKE